MTEAELAAAETALRERARSPSSFASPAWMTQWRLGELSLARIESQRQTVHRTEAGVQRDPTGGYYANLQVSGASLMAQHGRVATLLPGDLAVVDADEPFRFEFGGDFRQLSLFVPAADGRHGRAGPHCHRRGHHHRGGCGRASLDGDLDAWSAAEERPARLALHAAGMLSIALEPAILTPVRSPRSYQTCSKDIEEHLTDEDLSPAATARRLGISVRTVHGLFAGHEASYCSHDAAAAAGTRGAAPRRPGDAAPAGHRRGHGGRVRQCGELPPGVRRQFGRTPNAARG